MWNINAGVLVHPRHTQVQLAGFIKLWCKFLENLTGSQLLKKFPALYGIRKFITALTSTRHLHLS